MTSLTVGDKVWVCGPAPGGGPEPKEVTIFELRRERDGLDWIWVRHPNGTTAAYKLDPEARVWATRQEAEEGIREIMAKSQAKADASPPLEDSPPSIGHDLIDQLIFAAWQHGHDVAAADEGYGDYPDGSEVRALARLVRDGD